MSKLHLLSSLICFLALGGISFAETSESVVRPVVNQQEIAAAAAAPQALPMSEIGEGILDVEYSFAKQYQAVVKVEVSTLTPNYAMPWLPGAFGGGTGTAFLIAPNLFMTNAHVVSNAQQLYVSKYGESRKIPAQVVFIAHDCDLALLQVSDYRPFEKMKPLKLGALPKLEDEVRAIGYPMGGERLSVTRGVVSRIDTVPYSHSVSDAHLVVQIDAAINPGNSGGPVLMGDRVVGVVFQGMSAAQNLGFVIPVPVIEHFLKDIQDGKYDGYVGLGIMEFAILNSAMREELGLPDDEKGVLVAEIYKSGPAQGILKPGDVILKIEGKDVDSSGKIEMDGETVSMNELAERKFAGEKLAIEIMRDKKKEEVSVTLAPVKSRSILAAAYDQKPRYVVFAGLVFQPAERNTFVAHKLNAPELNVEVEDFVLRGGDASHEDLVLLTSVLPDEVNEQLNIPRSGVVSKVNGTEVKSLRHLYELLHPAIEGIPPFGFFVIELKGESRPIVLDTGVVNEANARISKQYKIVNDSLLN